MIKARLLCSEPDGSLIHGFLVEGHAHFAKRGTDIVCAGVSAICQTTYYGLVDLLGEGEVEWVARSGDMRVLVSVKKASEPGPRALFRAFQLGIEEMAKSYPRSLRVTQCESPLQGGE